MDELREAKPGQAFSVLKRLGAQPGDSTDSNTFSLPVHESESLSPQQCAESIALHFARISQEFPPLSLDWYRNTPTQIHTQHTYKGGTSGSLGA